MYGFQFDLMFVNVRLQMQETGLVVADYIFRSFFQCFLYFFLCQGGADRLIVYTERASEAATKVIRFVIGQFQSFHVLQ